VAECTDKFVNIRAKYSDVRGCGEARTGGSRDSVGKLRGPPRSWRPVGSWVRGSLPGVAMVASTLRKLKSLVLSQTTDNEQIANLLDTVSVPLHTGDCRTCPDPCTEGTSSHLCFPPQLSSRDTSPPHPDPIFGGTRAGHEDWKFDRDMETQMLGTVKPYIRQVKNLSPVA